MNFLLYIVVALICAMVADAVFPGQMPGGLLVTGMCGFIGAWGGVQVFGAFGPMLAGVSLLPAILGCGGIMLVVALMHSTARRNSWI